MRLVDCSCTANRSRCAACLLVKGREMECPTLLFLKHDAWSQFTCCLSSLSTLPRRQRLVSKSILVSSYVYAEKTRYCYLLSKVKCSIGFGRAKKTTPVVLYTVSLGDFDHTWATFSLVKTGFDWSKITHPPAQMHIHTAANQSGRHAFAKKH